MRITVFVLSALLLVSRTSAQNLPELGDTSGALMSPQMERKIGEQAMRDIRYNDPQFLDDPELTDYINTVGRRIVAVSPDARQDFNFFFLRDRAINAFSMPGGFIGVNSGLILNAQTESELAGVLSHEVAHVTQHHIARMIGKQDQYAVPLLAAMVLGMIAARSNANLGQAVIMMAGAGSIQSQLNYSRDFEREADRIGFQYLQSAGFDSGGMASFFERLQKATRLYENNAPGYMRTHPLTEERIADMENRSKDAAYRQIPSSVEFHLVRSKLRAEEGLPKEAVAHFEEQVREHRHASEAGARYGLASALVRARDFSGAERETGVLRKFVGEHPMIELLAARARTGAGDLKGARDILQAALARSPNHRPLQYALVEAQQNMGQHTEASAALSELIKTYPRDPKLYDLRAKSYAALGKQLLQHQALAEVYYFRGALPAAIDQLQLAQKSGDGDFYQLSAVEARLRELRALQAEEAKQRR